jgi:hypothetical protein
MEQVHRACLLERKINDRMGKLRHRELTFEVWFADAWTLRANLYSTQHHSLYGRGYYSSKRLISVPGTDGVLGI